MIPIHYLNLTTNFVVNIRLFRLSLVIYISTFVVKTFVNSCQNSFLLESIVITRYLHLLLYFVLNFLAMSDLLFATSTPSHYPVQFTLPDKMKDDFQHVIQVVRPQYKAFVKSLSPNPGEYLHIAFFDPDSPALLEDPGPAPSRDQHYDDMTEEEQAQHHTELSMEINLWRLSREAYVRQMVAIGRMRQFLDALFPITSGWREELFPLDLSQYYDAIPWEIWRALLQRFNAQGVDITAIHASLVEQLRTQPFVYSNSESWMAFWANFTKTINYANDLGIREIQESEGATYLIAALRRCSQLASMTEFRNPLFEYEQAHQDATRTFAEVRRIAQPCLHRLVKLSPATVKHGFAHAAQALDHDNLSQADDILQADTSPQNLLTSDGLAFAAQRKPSTVTPGSASIPSGNGSALPASFTITTSDPTLLKPIMERMLAASAQPRPKQKASAPKNPSAGAAPPTSKPYPKMYCFSCGTLTGPDRHFSNNCPAHLRKAGHNERCNFKNWQQFPGAAQP